MDSLERRVMAKLEKEQVCQTLSLVDKGEHAFQKPTPPINVRTSSSNLAKIVTIANPLNNIGYCRRPEGEGGEDGIEARKRTERLLENRVSAQRYPARSLLTTPLTVTLIPTRNRDPDSDPDLSSP